MSSTLVESQYTRINLDTDNLQIAEPSVEITGIQVTDGEFLPQSKLQELNHKLCKKTRSVTVSKDSQAKINVKSMGSGGIRTIITVQPGVNFTLDMPTSGEGILHDEFIEITIKEDAHVIFNSIQDLSNQTILISHKKAILEKNATIKWNSLNLGSSKSKCERTTNLQGDGSSVVDQQIDLLTGESHVDTTTNINHIARNTQSKISIKGCLAQKSRQIAYGNVNIGEQASGTNSYLEEHSLILSKDARADSIPALEILTNDIMAKHAATCTQLDDEKLFYLSSRGISKEDSKKLIVHGFIAGASQKMGSEIEQKSEQWLEKLNP